MVSITPSPDFSKLRVHVMKLLLDNACVFHWCSQGQCAQNRIHGVPTFPVPPSTPQMSGSHPVSTPHPPHRQSPRNLPRLFFPFKPTFSLNSPALHALQAIFTVFLFCLLPAPRIFLIPSVILGLQAVQATLHLPPFHMLLFPTLAIVSRHQSNHIKSRYKTLTGLHSS